MDDLIRRSDAIRLAEQGQIQGFPWQFEQLVKLPSAQPNLQPTCNQLATDCIRRQDAIDALWEKRQALNDIMDKYLRDDLLVLRQQKKIERNRIEEDINIIEELPSAQPEPTYEQVMEYCKKRCMSLVTNEFLAHMYSQSAQPEHPLLKIIQDFKEMTGCEDVLVVQKDAMKAWDENGVAYTMQPERKKGEWVNARDGYDGHVKCNKCFKTYDWTSDAQYFNFCPHCGAEMKGENNV